MLPQEFFLWEHFVRFGFKKYKTHFCLDWLAGVAIKNATEPKTGMIMMMRTQTIRTQSVKLSIVLILNRAIIESIGHNTNMAMFRICIINRMFVSI